MKTHKIGINIQTDKTGRGAEDTTTALNQVEDAASEANEELDKVDGVSPEVPTTATDAAEALDKTSESSKKLGEEQESGARKMSFSAKVAETYTHALDKGVAATVSLARSLPSLISNIAGPAALTAVIGLATVAIGSLIKRLTTLKEGTGSLDNLLKTSTEQVDEFYKRAAEDGTSGLRESIRSTILLLGQQNDRLASNVTLIQKKRQAQLDLAALDDDLDLANIALAQSSGQVSNADADAQRREIEIRKIKRASDEAILRATEELALAEDQRAANARAQLTLASRINSEKERELALLEERNRLQSSEEVATKQRERGQKKIDESGFFSPGKRGEGQGEVAGADILFTENDRKRLLQLDSVILPQQEAIVGALEDALQSKEDEQSGLSRLEAAAFQNLKLTNQTQTRTAEVQKQVIETQAAAQTAASASADVAAGVAELGALSESAILKTEQERRIITESQTRLQSFLSDGVITATEFAETNRLLASITQTQVSAQSAVSQTVAELQAAVANLQAQAAQLGANQIRLNNTTGG